jgi:hypothetical protein
MTRLGEWWQEYTAPLKDDREKDKTETVNALVKNITQHKEEWTPSEQTEILSRVTLRVFETQKTHRDRLIKEAREYQESLKTIKL